MNDKILIIDDETKVIKAIIRALSDEPIEILTATSGAEALDLIRENEIKVVISDEMMPGMSGSEVLAVIKKRYPETMRIMLTGYPTAETAIKAINLGEAYRFLGKPWNNIDLRLALRSALKKYKGEEKN